MTLGRRPVVAAVAALGLLLAGCARGEPTPPTTTAGGGEGSPAQSQDPPAPGGVTPRVVLFGIDGADWAVINPLIAAGRMPHLARVVREGASGTLLSMEPSASPSLWTTIATGVTPDRHGIHNFVVPVNGPAAGGAGANPGAGETEEAAWGGAPVRPVTSTMRQAPAFWNILGHYDRRVGVVGWLVTWPAEPVNGFIVSTYLPYVYNWSTGRPLKGTLVEGIPHQTFPEGLIDEVEPFKVRPEDIDAATIRRYYDPAAVERLPKTDRECVTGFRWSLACDETYRKIGRHLFGRYPVDLFAVYFGGVDVASHRFWKFAHPDAMPYGVRPADAPILAGVIDAYYQHVDEALGEYLADLGPSDTVVVLSDHGFHAVWDPARPDTSGHHRLEGIIALRGRGIAPGKLLPDARLVDVLPTVLRLLDLPIARNLEGRAIVAAFDRDFLAAHPERQVDDYGLAGAAPGPVASDLDENILERLKSLGYIR